MERIELKPDLGTNTPFALWRLDFYNERYYYRYDKDGNPEIFPGVTSLLGKVLPTSPELIKWFKEKGLEADKYFKERELYGSFYHGLVGKYHKRGYYDPTEMEAELREYIENDRDTFMYLGISVGKWIKDINKDMLAYFQFLADTDFIPIAIELPFYSSKYKVASSIDLWGTMNIEEKGFYGEVYKSGPRKGEPKETKQVVNKRVIIDIKSGRNVYQSDSHEAQLAFYHEMIKEHYPDLADCEIFNLHPSQWRTTPGYTLVNQTGKCDEKYLENLSYMYYRKYDPANKKKIFFEKSILGEAPKFRIKTIREILTS